MADEDSDITDDVRERLSDGDQINTDSDSGSDPLFTTDADVSSEEGEEGEE